MYIKFLIKFLSILLGTFKALCILNYVFFVFLTTLIFVVCGDFNLPKVCWPETGCWVNYGGQEEESFLNGCDDCFVTQVIDRSKFDANGMGGNVVDLILTSDPERVLDIEYCPPSSVRLGHASNKNDVSKANFKVISEEMSKVDWETT